MGAFVPDGPDVLDLEACTGPAQRFDYRRAYREPVLFTVPLLLACQQSKGPSESGGAIETLGFRVGVACPELRIGHLTLHEFQAMLGHVVGGIE